MDAVTLTLKDAEWDTVAEVHFQKGFRRAWDFRWQDLRALVQADRASIFAVFEGDARIGSIAVEPEVTRYGWELNVIATYGERPGLDLFASCLPALEQLASKRGALAVRCLVHDPAVVKKLGALGFRQSRVILRKVL